MLGEKRLVPKLVYRFTLEERVPADHLLRRVAAGVDFSFVRRLTARFYSHTGQPGIDPVVLFKMALLGYLYGITSERRLAEAIQLNLAFMWFIGYDIDERTPDHSVLSKARQRFGVTTYRAFFTEIVRQCEQAGLVQGNRLYVDSTLVKANASCPVLLHVHRNGDIGSPRVSGSTSASNAASSPGSRSRKRLRPPPGCRTLPPRSVGCSSSASAL